MNSLRLLRVGALTPAVLLIFQLSGCGDIKRSDLHGTVKWNGQPLAETTIIFMGGDNMTYPVDLKADGTYEIKGVPCGKVKVSLQQRPPSVLPKAEPGRGPAPKMGEAKDAKLLQTVEPVRKQVPRLPAQYSDTEKSGLAFELTEPIQEWSVDLK